MRVQARAQEAGSQVTTISDGDFARFASLIREQTGIHLRDHKGQLLIARLGQRLRTLGIESFSAYYKLLMTDKSGEELRVLINRITTNKTSFFREPHHFEFIRSQLIPQITRNGQRTLRVWSAGCSSGEEPYSIAITMLHALGKHHDWDLRVLATDIDTEVLRQAASGQYAMESLKDMPLEWQREYFLRGFGEFEGLAQVRPELRRMVGFQRLNLNEPSWGIHEQFDVIFCRNVIIYFERPVQERIVRNLTAHLRCGGYFFSGHSENLHYLRDLLSPVSTAIYRLQPGASDL